MDTSGVSAEFRVTRKKNWQLMNTVPLRTGHERKKRTTGANFLRLKISARASYRRQERVIKT